MTGKDFLEAIEKAYRARFPHGGFVAKQAVMVGKPAILIMTWMQGDKSKLPNGILENDVALQRFWIHAPGTADPDAPLADTLRIEGKGDAGRLTVKPAEGSHYAFESVKFGWRDFKGTPEQVVKHMTSYFAKMKKTVEDNRERVAHEVPTTARAIVATLVKAGRRDLARVVAKLFVGDLLNRNRSSR